uniref:Uncharacterized protein n=1 Tax=Arundo donax TaxID=35708 RepID=A0A0A9A3C6_ARUDO
MPHKQFQGYIVVSRKY